MSLYRIGVALEEHPHTCPRCGHRWWHGSENLGDVEAHTCPGCGGEQWVIGADKPAPAGMQYVTLIGMAGILGAIAYVLKPRRV